MPIRDNSIGLVTLKANHTFGCSINPITDDGFGRFRSSSVLPNVSCRLFVSLEACDQRSLGVYAPS